MAYRQKMKPLVIHSMRNKYHPVPPPNMPGNFQLENEN